MKVSNIDVLFGDLPVTVNAYICPAEYDVGIMTPYVEDWEITHIMGRKCKRMPKTIYNRMKAADIDALESSIIEAIENDY